METGIAYKKGLRGEMQHTNHRPPAAPPGPSSMSLASRTRALRPVQCRRASAGGGTTHRTENPVRVEIQHSVLFKFWEGIACHKNFIRTVVSVFICDEFGWILKICRKYETWRKPTLRLYSTGIPHPDSTPCRSLGERLPRIPGRDARPCTPMLVAWSWRASFEGNLSSDADWL